MVDELYNETGFIIRISITDAHHLIVILKYAADARHLFVILMSAAGAKKDLLLCFPACHDKQILRPLRGLRMTRVVFVILMSAAGAKKDLFFVIANPWNKRSNLCLSGNGVEQDCFTNNKRSFAMTFY